MTVLWLPSWYPHRADPLLGNFIKRHAEAVSPLCEILVLYAVQGDKAYEIAVEKDKFTTIIVYFPSTKNPFLKLIRYVKAWSKGFNFIIKTENKPDLVHLNVAYPAGIGALWLYVFHKIPFVMSEHWSGFSPQKSGFDSLFRKIITTFCFKYAKKVIVLSKSLNRWYLKRKDVEIPNVVDVHLFSPYLPIISGQVSIKLFSDSRASEKQVIKLLHVSSLNENQKNISGILRGIDLLKNKRADFTLTLVGDETQHFNYQKQIDLLNGNQPFIYMHPALPHADIAHQIQNADIFILFSFYENQPCVILEALATGLPVVCSETGGMSDWINDKTGKIVPIADERAFAEALNDVMNNLDNYNPAEIRHKIVEKCCYEAVGKAIFEVYVASIKSELCD